VEIASLPKFYDKEELIQIINHPSKIINA